uniref:HAT C-terminal dimerisation domain-containing protein n=1 Tax=Octopus bimaculoides TaxID=37653 RepID=A0A0L8I4P2_OCTBM
MDLTDRLLTTFKTNTRYSKPQLAKSGSSTQSTSAVSSTFEQITLNQFYRRRRWRSSASIAYNTLKYRQPIDKVLADIYNSKREIVKDAVKNSKAIVLTSDCWTSLGNESYCRITGHWIANDWKLISVIPELRSCLAVKSVSCSCILPLLLSLTKHMTINVDDPGYIARFKVASVNDFSKRVADMKCIETLQIATKLDPRYKNLKCLSDDSEEQTWLLIGLQIAADVNDDRLKTNAQDDADSKLNERRYPKLAFFAKTVLCIPATSVLCERLFSSAGYIVNIMHSSLEPNTVNMIVCLRNCYPTTSE